MTQKAIRQREGNHRRGNANESYTYEKVLNFTSDKGSGSEYNEVHFSPPTDSQK